MILIAEGFTAQLKFIGAADALWTSRRVHAATSSRTPHTGSKVAIGIQLLITTEQIMSGCMCL